MEQISRLLDNPGQVPLSERIGPRVDDLAAAVKVALEQRAIAEAAAPPGRARAGISHSAGPIRISGPPRASCWTSWPRTARSTAAKNAAILPTLSDLIVNLSPLRPDNDKEMVALRALGQNAFETIQGRPGLFQLSGTGTALQAINATRN